MTPGPVEEGSKVAQSVVDALKTQPLSLALITMNVVFIIFVGFLLYSLNSRTTHQYEIKDQLISKLFDQCGKPNQ
jgi:hypothetical protein